MIEKKKNEKKIAFIDEVSPEVGGCMILRRDRSGDRGRKVRSSYSDRARGMQRQTIETNSVEYVAAGICFQFFFFIEKKKKFL